MIGQEKLTLAQSASAEESFADNVLRIALDIGEGLLKSGGEIHRVEFTIEKICKSYGAEHVEVFSINSLILASIRMADGSYSSQNRRITDVSNHLLCLERYNRLSREICATKPEIDKVDEEIRRIKKKRIYPLWALLVGHVIAAGAFAIFFGGSLRDGIAAGLTGLVIALINNVKADYFNSMTKTLFTSFFGGALSCLTVWAGIGENMDMVAIGTIMLLIPGLSLGNAARDLVGGDTLTGVLKSVQAVIIAVMISIGYAISIVTFGDLCPDAVQRQYPEIVRWIAGAITAAVGTCGFAMIFKASAKRLAWVAFGGAVGYVVYEATVLLGGGVLLAAFMSALFIALFSEVSARCFKAPAAVFLFTCAIPIVPGSSLYYTMYNLLKYNYAECLIKFQTTVQIILGMALGISVATVAFGMAMQFINKLSHKRTAR